MHTQTNKQQQQQKGFVKMYSSQRIENAHMLGTCTLVHWVFLTEQVILHTRMHAQRAHKHIHTHYLSLFLTVFIHITHPFSPSFPFP
jgi:hypothetical protein